MCFFCSLLSRECFSFVYRGRGEVGLDDAGAVKVEEGAWRNGDAKVLREGAEDRECEGLPEADSAAALE